MLQEQLGILAVLLSQFPLYCLKLLQRLFEVLLQHLLLLVVMSVHFTIIAILEWAAVGN